MRLTPTIIRAIDAWKPSVGYNVGVGVIIERALRRGVRQPRGAPATTEMLLRYIRRENRRAVTTFYASKPKAS